ncbi:mediator of RNA polymerase II transcription subunit 26 isoform X1 [Lucilia cuprina]|uniref:mediator of RNA polymerase II transcription subunit 26 isoform X1 n=1 Tax=Lucilia cuprina TaxID=7375 RepID=UPI001F065A65|nr:mediator of RNA polymerase II transcription subunit 26 isoform X1 [Lucilia cuprina]
MNNKHIHDLTLRLSQSLDQNYDVVSMETVLSVISALEGTTITKEQLEATRLAKYINQLRRRTKCENLARRAKSLLKKWREMVGIQQSSESSSAVVSSGAVTATGPTVSNPISTPTAPYNMPVTDNAVSTSHLKNPQISHQQQNRQNQYPTSVKQHQIQQQPYHSQPSSPVNLQDKSNPNEYLISMSNPATGSQMTKSSITNIRKKKRLEKSLNNELITQQQPKQQPTSFANLITGLGSTFPLERKNPREKCEPVASTVNPVETFIIEHSSNSNSDLICLPSNNTVSNFTSATDVPPVVIDLQDTNSSMTSLVSKDLTNASSSYYKTKTSTKKSKKEKKRKDRNITSRKNQSIQDCEDQNTTTASYQHKRTNDVLQLDEKSHSACPTISNISEILSLSNSSMSSVFPSTDAISKNVFQSGQNDLAASSVKMSNADLTFAGKFKNTSSTSGGCNVLNYNSDSMNVNILTSNSPNQNKFSLFGGGVGTTNSNDSSSNSRNSQFNVVNAIKTEASNSKHNMEDILVKPDINDKSMSNMSNKGNSSTDNLFAGVGSSTITPSQQQQSIDLTTMDFSSQQAVKQPKKRGRKKGSKGVDSVIAKETSLSSQMLISSLSVGGKKVKTTKELYAEMENRKLQNVKIVGLGETAGNSSGNWNAQQQQLQQKPVISRRPSYCSDIAESDSCTMTSEPSRDSGNTLSKNIGKRETPMDNNSNYSELKISIVKGDDGSTNTIDPNSTLAITTKIKKEIQEILKLLTPPPSIKEIEYDCYNNITPCTCTVEEVIVPAENDPNENSNGESSIADINLNVVAQPQIPKMENSSFTVNNIRIATVSSPPKSNQNVSILPQPPPKIKKSIFDLDFDDDEDPLKSIIADIVGKNSKSDAEVETNVPVVDEKPDIPLSTDDDIGKVVDHQTAPSYALNVPTTSSDMIVFPSYEIKFDKDCEAKNRFDVQTQKITKFHIDTLHNCFIPNVNGNWNHSDYIASADCSSQTLERNLNGHDQGQEDLIMDGYDVVPLYGSDVNEQIIKDLSHVKFTKKYKFKHTKCKNEILFHIPFLGVSRTPDVACVSDVKMGNKYLHKIKLEEEKENDNKINFTNMKNNDILPNEKEGCDAKEMERVQNVDSLNTINLAPEKTNLKRTKEYKTLKRSRIKRIKSTISYDKNYEGNIKNKEFPKNNQHTSSSGGDSDSDSFDGDFVNDHNYVSEADQNISSQEQDSNISNEFEQEVVNQDISQHNEGKNHIVLIIKKTAGSPTSSNLKTNSPLNSLTHLSSENSREENVNLIFVANEVKNERNYHKSDSEGDIKMSSLQQQKRLRKKAIKRKNDNVTTHKLHNTLFYHEELFPMVWNGSYCHKERIFQISSCSSGCSEDEESANVNLTKKSTISSPSSSISSERSDNKYEGHMFNLQHDIIQSEFLKRCTMPTVQRDMEIDNLVSDNIKIQSEDEEGDDDDLPEENNHMLLSFNNICNKYTRDENADNYKQPQEENKDHEENNMLKQQQKNCDDYNNLNNNNFNLIKYIDNKTSSVNNINNNSCSNNYSDTNIVISSSSCSHKNPTNYVLINQKNLNNNDNNSMKEEEIKPLKEYQTGIRAVDEDVNDDDGNNCARLQKFKEWHEVLQLRSYNDELLTVLPYVVLE